MVHLAAPAHAILSSDASLLLQGSSNASVRTCDELKLSKIWCSGQILPKEDGFGVLDQWVFRPYQSKWLSMWLAEHLRDLEWPL